MDYLRSKLWLNSSKSSTATSGMPTKLWREPGFDVVIMGAGQLGQSLTKFPSFGQHGLRVVGLFDCDPQKVGTNINGITVESTEKLRQSVERRGVCRAIIAVPPLFAQRAADQLVEAGIKFILNYAPINLNVPLAVVCERIDPALQFNRLLLNSPSLVLSSLVSDLPYAQGANDSQSWENLLLDLQSNRFGINTVPSEATAQAVLDAQASQGSSFSPLRGVSYTFPLYIEYLQLIRQTPKSSSSSSTMATTTGTSKETREEENSFFQFLQQKRSETSTGSVARSYTPSVGKWENSSNQSTADEERPLEVQATNVEGLEASSSLGAKSQGRDSGFIDDNEETLETAPATPRAPRQRQAVTLSRTPHSRRPLSAPHSQSSAATPKTGNAKRASPRSSSSTPVPVRASNLLAASPVIGFGRYEEKKEEHDQVGWSLSKASIGRKTGELDVLYGLDDCKEMLEYSISSMTRDGFAFSGVLLYGPPGSGKSSLINCALVDKLKEGCGCFVASAGELTSTKRIQNLFASANEAASRAFPSIICIESVDILCKSDHLKLAFLKELDTSPGCTLLLASTSLPWEIDVSILRHFERRIAIPLPGKAARGDIFRNAISSRRLPLPAEKRLDQLVKATKGYSASEITLVVKDTLAGFNHLPKNSRQDDKGTLNYEKAISHIKPSISKEIALLYASFSARFGYESPNAGPVSEHKHDPPYLSLYC